MVSNAFCVEMNRAEAGGEEGGRTTREIESRRGSGGAQEIVITPFEQSVL